MTDRSITHKSLTAERNLLLVGFFILFGLNVAFGTAFQFGLPEWDLLGGFAVLLVVAARVAYVYLVYRLSRFLGQPPLVTLVYSVLALFAGFELIPLIGLLVAIKRTRDTIEETP